MISSIYHIYMELDFLNSGLQDGALPDHRIAMSFNNLPTEILAQIMQLAHESVLKQGRCVNWTLCHIIDDILWKKVYISFSESELHVGNTKFHEIPVFDKQPSPHRLDPSSNNHPNVPYEKIESLLGCLQRNARSIQQVVLFFGCSSILPGVTELFSLIIAEAINLQHIYLIAAPWTREVIEVFKRGVPPASGRKMSLTIVIKEEWGGNSTAIVDTFYPYQDGLKIELSCDDCLPRDFCAKYGRYLRSLDLRVRESRMVKYLNDSLEFCTQLEILSIWFEQDPNDLNGMAAGASVKLPASVKDFELILFGIPPPAITFILSDISSLTLDLRHHCGFPVLFDSMKPLALKELRIETGHDLLASFPMPGNQVSALAQLGTWETLTLYMSDKEYRDHYWYYLLQLTPIIEQTTKRLRRIWRGTEYDISRYLETDVLRSLDPMWH